MISRHKVGGAGEHVIRHGEQEAVVVEAGGGLRTYAIGSVDVVAGYPEGTVCPNARGQWLVPWPNRIREGRYEFGGEQHQLPIRDPETTTAIHGLVRWLPFHCVAKDDAWIELATVSPARPGYPWDLYMWVRWSLGDAGLSAELRVENLSAGEAPFAAGAHPYLHLGDALVDDVTVTVPAATVLTGEQHVLTERHPVGPDTDFRRGRPVGDSRLGLYTDLERDADGPAQVVVDRPDGWRITVWQDAAWPFVLLYTADLVSAEEGVRRSLAVEPMTAPADAFNSGDGLRVLKPGESFEGSWGIKARERQ